MASSPPAVPKRLKGHLGEQQEPFSLHAYFLERGLTVKCMSSGVGNGCCSINLFSNLDRSPFSRGLLLRSTRMLKLVLFKLIYSNSSQEDEIRTAETKLDEFRTAETKLEEESYDYEMPTWIFKQKISTFLTQKYEKTRELQVRPLKEKYNNNGFIELNKETKTFCSNYQRSKGKYNLGQLIFGCIDESKGTQMEDKEKNRENYNKKFISLEGFGKHDAGRKKLRYIINAAELNNMIISSTLAEWNNPEQMLRDVVIDIGNSIMEEIIEETVQLCK